jgi:hypothetical protein
MATFLCYQGLNEKLGKYYDPSSNNIGPILVNIGPIFSSWSNIGAILANFSLLLGEAAYWHP